MPKKELFDIACNLLHETPRAFLVDAGGKEKVWLPKSQCEVESNPNGDGHIATMPEWLAKEKGLI